MQSSPFDNCVHVYSIEVLDLFDPELQLINVKPIIKNILKDLLGELKKFKDQKILVLECYKMNDHKSMPKIFHLNTKLIVNDSHIDKAFRSMHQNVVKKIKNFVSADSIVKTIVGHGIKIFEC